MLRKINAAFFAATSLLTSSVDAQTTLEVPVGNNTAKPVQQTVSEPADSPEEIARDAARDLKDTRFYNKPGATRAQYEADWQQCRLIARGSRTPTGTIPYYYNPAVISPLAAGVGAGLGGALAAVIIEGQQRRANRRQCLLIRGWRLVEVPPADSARVTAMTDQQRADYFGAQVGANDVKGKITEIKQFSTVRDANLRLDAPLPATGVLFAGKKVDPAQPMILGPDDAMIVLGYRRTDPKSAGRIAAIWLLRYDVEHRDVIYRPKDWKKKQDKTVYGVTALSNDKKAAYEVQLIKVTPGDYVIDALSAGLGIPMTTNCFGAPVVHVSAGEIAYIGDFHPYINAELSDGSKITTLAYSRHLEDARTVLARQQPLLSSRLRSAALHGQATYACAGITMTRWDIDGLEPLPPVATSNPVEATAVTAR